MHQRFYRLGKNMRFILVAILICKGFPSVHSAQTTQLATWGMREVNLLVIPIYIYNNVV